MPVNIGGVNLLIPKMSSADRMLEVLLIALLDKLFKDPINSSYAPEEFRELAQYLASNTTVPAINRIRTALRPLFNSGEFLALISDNPDLHESFLDLKQIVNTSIGNTAELEALPEAEEVNSATKSFIDAMRYLSSQDTIDEESVSLVFAEMKHALSLSEAHLRDWRKLFVLTDGDDVGLRAALFRELMPHNQGNKLSQLIQIYWNIYHDHQWVMFLTNNLIPVTHPDYHPNLITVWRNTIENTLQELGVSPVTAADEIRSGGRLSEDSQINISARFAATNTSQERFALTKLILRQHSHALLDTIELLCILSIQSGSESIPSAMKPMIVAYIQTIFNTKHENPLYRGDIQFKRLFKLIIQLLPQLMPDDLTQAENLKILLEGIIEVPALARQTEMRNVVESILDPLRSQTAELETAVVHQNRLSPLAGDES